MPTSKKKLAKLRAGVPLPKPDLKKEREARRRASKAVRDANRDECLRLDGCRCRNPECDCNESTALECAIVGSHHILKRTKDNRFDGVEYRIMLSQRCHAKYDTDRVGMLRILKELKRTALDFRWQPAIDELEKMI